MNNALVAINSANRTVEIVSVGYGDDDTWAEIRERKLIAVPTTLDMARHIFDKRVNDIYELTENN